MIDIHTHILPDIDDGAQTLEESLGIIKNAVNEGVKTLVATPHVLEVPSESEWHKVRDKFNSVKQALISEKIDIDIILGAELFISPDLPIKITQNRELTINSGNRYALLELPVQGLPPFTEQTIFELLLKRIVPIIAHPERCVEIQNDFSKMSNLVEKGVLAQANSGSLIGRYGKKVQKTCRTLLENNLIHIIGSDIHSIFNGSYPLSQGVKLAAEIVGIDEATAMVTSIPMKVIERFVNSTTP